MMFTSKKISPVSSRLFARLGVPSVLLLVFLLAFLGLEASAQAEGRVVILNFTGPQSSKFQKQVEPLVRDSADVVSSARFRKATKQLRRFKANRNGLRKIARRLKLTGFIEGKVTRRRGKFTLSLSFRDAQGDVLSDEVTVTSKRPRLSPKEKKRVRRELSRVLGKLGDGGEDEDEDDDLGGEDEEEEEDEDRDDEEEDEEDRDDEEEDDDVREDEDEDRDDEDDADEKVEKTGDDDDGKDDAGPGPGLRSRAVEAAVGLSFTSRNLSFDADASAAAPQGYSGALVPGLLVDANVYPLAFDSKRKGVLRNIGVNVVFDRVLQIESKLQGMEETVLETNQSRLGFGAVYRHNFSPEKDSGISIRGTLRYSILSFNIDKEGAPAVTIPNVDYTYIEPGLSISIPVTSKIDIAAGGHLYVIQATGEIQEADQYGGAGVSGFDAELTASYMITSQILVRAGARYAAINYAFDGSGTLTDRDSNQEQDVSGATDSYTSLFATAGYLF